MRSRDAAAARSVASGPAAASAAARARASTLALAAAAATSSSTNLYDIRRPRERSGLSSTTWTRTTERAPPLLSDLTAASAHSRSES